MGIPFLTISIPAYNDSPSLYKLVHEAEDLCAGLNLDFSILIIDDGSNDDTLEVIEELGKKFDNIKVHSHSVNLGFGKTLQEVFTMPVSQWVLFLPGDNQFPVSNLNHLLSLKDDYDFIIGYRKYRKDGIRRKFYSILYNKVIALVSGISVRDANSIVFYRTDTLRNISLKSNSAFIHAEFLIKVVRAGFRVHETEVIHKEREFGFGAGGNLRVIMATIRELFIFLAAKKQ